MTLAIWDELFGFIMALVVFVSTLKFIKMLKFNRRMGIMGDTIRLATRDLKSFSVIFFVYFFAFAQVCRHVVFLCVAVQFTCWLCVCQVTYMYALCVYQAAYISALNVPGCLHICSVFVYQAAYMSTVHVCVPGCLHVRCMCARLPTCCSGRSLRTTAVSRAASRRFSRSLSATSTLTHSKTHRR